MTKKKTPEEVEKEDFTDLMKSNFVGEMIHLFDLEKVDRDMAAENTIPVTFRLGEDYNEILEAMATDYGFKKAKMVRDIMEEFIRNAGEMMNMSGPAMGSPAQLFKKKGDE